MAKKVETFTVTDNRTGKSWDFPVLKGTMGPDVVDVRKFYAETGCFTYDPSFTSTSACDSEITFIDGEKGILTYRGYPIEQLAEQSDFMDVCYLLLYGELPTAVQKLKFEDDIMHHTMMHEKLRHFFDGFRMQAHPMSILCGVTGALGAFYHDRIDIKDPTYRMIASYRVLSKMPTIAAAAYKYSVGQPFVYPRNDLTYSENFLHMLFATPCEDYEVNPVLARAMDLILILHADHEQNASTSTVRMAGSTGTNPFAAVAAGIAALWGPAHGGANEAVLRMLDEIGSKDRIPEFIKRAKDPDDPFRLMGFGHRVYKNYDPRARIMQRTCNEVLDALAAKDEPLLELAMELERIALEDEFFIERKLYPNVDFYSGIIFRAMKIPSSMFTVMFAVARSIGWVAQWNEMITDPTMRIARPRQLYTGSTLREFKPVDQRG